MEPQCCSPERPQSDPLHLLLQLVQIDENCSMLAIEDVTSAVEHEREVSRQRRRMALALEHIRGYGVVMLDGAGTVIEWNPSIGRLFGVAEGTLSGQQLLDWVAGERAGEGGSSAPTSFEAIRTAVAKQGWCQLQAPWRRVDGSRLWGDCVITPLIEADGGTSGYVAVVRDTTEEHHREQQLLEEALTDPLTGLCNRRGLERRWELLQPRLATGKGRPVWIMIDIDHFKQVNDTHGHEVGDAVLKALAADLQVAAREGDVAARLGGEEFVLLLPSATSDVAAVVAERLRGRIQRLTVATGGHTVQVTASFGVSLQAAGEEWATALQRADAALYAAKRGGRNRVVLSVEAPAAD
jgi:diguanylate cyclase (GGDEF)-like protein/PAS domain S-box-containing protein